MPAEQFSLQFDPGYTVEERISARARHVKIEIRSHTEVRLVIPKYSSREAALAFLESRRGWIDTQVKKMRRQHESVDVFGYADDGVTALWNGEPKKVHIVAYSGKQAVLKRGEKWELYISRSGAEDKKVVTRELRKIFKEEARKLAEPVLNQEAARADVTWEKLRLGDQKTLWGSCAADGTISLNWRLVMAPPEVLRYVIIHELCHVRWRSHGPRFWAMVARQMPEFERWRIWLKQNGYKLHAALSA